MMQALGVMPDVIYRCQNHVLAGSRVRRHYLKHDYADETKRRGPLRIRPLRGCVASEIVWKP